MRSALFLFVFLATFTSSPDSFAAIDYHLEIKILPAEQRLEGKVVLQFKAEHPAPLTMQLSQHCRISSVNQAGQPIPWTFADGLLKVAPTSAADLEITYQGRFTDPVPTAPGHNEDPGYGVSAVISPRGSYLSGAVAWHPLLSSPPARYLVDIRLPAPGEAILAGQRLTRDSAAGWNRSSWSIDYPLAALTLAAGDYQVFEDHSGAIPIYAYFYPESAELAQTYLQQSREYLNLYQQLFGPYPFHKFAVVENFFPTGYGLSSWTLLGSSVIKLPFIVKTSLGHEIAHSWWGNGIRVDYAQGNWAEGLTTYVADYLYQEQQSAAAARQYRMNILSDYASLVTPANRIPVAEFSSRNSKASQAVGYGKAMMIFHMLRLKVGDQLFWQGLKEIAATRMFTAIGWDDFRDYYSRRSGEDLRPFFQQWLNRAQGPQLALAKVRAAATESGWVVSGELRQQAPYYRLDVPLQVATADGAKTSILTLRGAQQSFALQVREKPASLRVDPDMDLFRVLTPTEIPATVNSIRGSEHLLVLRGDTALPSVTARQTLLAGLRKPQHPLTATADADQQSLVDHDLLIFGSSTKLEPPTASEFQGSAPQKIAVTDNEVLFIVTRNPFNQAHYAAWFLADSAADSAVARKIPHYGKYSYLHFAGATNTDKQIISPADSPLQVTFPK
ncbi:M1 family metallopeptidase [Pelobacter seleniigenes]|uniref:M1 family metallopeptidase n=1 Tax=Pelobacter seleniigenes TaxID=407188 RepID=UPI000689B1EB|nr:M1 family aminopeptidase [Pelobacter seleniigenes]